MKTDEHDGSPVADGIEDRLARHFVDELGRAARDYPALEPLAPPAASTRRRRIWPRVLLAPLGAVAIVLALIVVVPLVLPAATPPVPGPAAVSPFPPTPAASAPSSSSAASGVVLGADGIPDQIDGRHVYRLAAWADWEKLSGSFLLGAYAGNAPIPCPSLASPRSQAEADLVPGCGSVDLTAHASGDSDFFLGLAPRGVDLLGPWLNESAIVMRVHTHDPEAASCAADTRTQCENAVVIEAVVWPAVPTEIGGERVYRAADRTSFPVSGSFLLGGTVTLPDLIPPCPQRFGISHAEQDLVPYCYWQAVDGIRVAPKGVSLQDVVGRTVVVSVHTGDAEAAQCPAAVQASCEAAIVVESIVWTGPAAAATPTLPGRSVPPNPVVTPPVPPAVPAS